MKLKRFGMISNTDLFNFVLGQSMGRTVPFHVETQMVGTSKGAFADAATEWLVPGVFSHVSCELIASSELPRTVWPLANKWFLTGMSPFVGFQMRRLGVFLETSGIRACMHNSRFAILRWTYTWRRSIV